MVKMQEVLFEERKIIKKIISPKDLHPNVLKGLIPVQTPCFVDERGQEVTVKSEGVEIPESKSHIEFLKEEVHLFPLIKLCVEKALELGWQYLFEISYMDEGRLDPETFKKIPKGIMIRGA